ncbi:hypothetical protein ACOSP7_024958 [Xanthoceras sorbifolium]
MEKIGNLKIIKKTASPANHIKNWDRNLLVKHLIATKPNSPQNYQQKAKVGGSKIRTAKHKKIQKREGRRIAGDLDFNKGAMFTYHFKRWVGPDCIEDIFLSSPTKLATTACLQAATLKDLQRWEPIVASFPVKQFNFTWDLKPLEHFPPECTCHP